MGQYIVDQSSALLARRPEDGKELLRHVLLLLTFRGLQCPAISTGRQVIRVGVFLFLRQIINGSISTECICRFLFYLNFWPPHPFLFRMRLATFVGDECRNSGYAEARTSQITLLPEGLIGFSNKPWNNFNSCSRRCLHGSDVECYAENLYV